MTSWLQDLILGMVQGITEWLPVSSEGINSLIMMLVFQKPASFSVQLALWLHSGTLLAALFYFWRDIKELARGLPNYLRTFKSSQASESGALTTFLIVSTLISGVVGGPLLFFLLANPKLETIPATTVTAIIGGCLIVTGLVQKFALKSVGQKTRVTLRDAIVVGLVQGLSVLPGFSRSGLTISTLLFQGYHPKQAVRVSFLMSIPVVFAAVAAINLNGQIDFNLHTVVGAIVAFIFGFLSIGILLKFTERVPFWALCLVLGVLSALPLVIESFLI